MENIYDTRKKENLLYVLPRETVKCFASKEILQSAAIVVNLYYENAVKRYMDYLNNVPEEIAVFVISSNLFVLKKVEELQKRPMQRVCKENRGRDISALLVTFRKFAQKYEYICFVHDKGAKQEYLNDDVQKWISNMWDNMIASEAYISNVLTILENNAEIGLLVPPEPTGEYVHAWYGDAWKDNYENCIKLAKSLTLCCDIREEKPPITLSTVFWARTKALNKLFSKEWKYEDFPEEPLAADGTISHAIERILGYVAQDAGYKVGTVMNEEYASWSLLFMQGRVAKLYPLLKRLSVHNLHQASVLPLQEERIKEFCNANFKVYLYGAGVGGCSLLEQMRKMNLIPEGFVVSNGKRSCMELEGYPVFELCELDKNAAIIVSVHYQLQNEIKRILNQEGYLNYIMGYI